jgi:hypothetical protein
MILANFLGWHVNPRWCIVRFRQIDSLSSVQMDSFVTTSPPEAHSANRVNEVARWFTWSRESRNVLRQWTTATRDISPPRLISLGLGTKYDRTYSCESMVPTDRSLVEWVHFLANELHTLRPPSDVIFFSDIFGAELNRHSLSLLVAAIRDAIVRITGDYRSALYTPLGSTGRAASGFPLHADLYVPEMLLNIFDDVSAGADSLLLPLHDLEVILSLVSSMPPAIRAEILDCFRLPADCDRFDRFYHMLYGSNRAWKEEISAVLAARQFQIRLNHGEAYLIHDRSWLHGRAAPAGEVSTYRVHRLVFSSAHSQTYRKAPA